MPNTAMPVGPTYPQAKSYVPPSPQWQAPAHALPSKARGVSAEAPARFVLPSPEALGVSANLNLPTAPNTQVDWNEIQARLERLKVLRFEKDRPTTGGVRVMMMLPTGDPKLGQPVQAHAETEAAAILLALDAAEAWTRKR